jgi:hypothetical protein
MSSQYEHGPDFQTPNEARIAALTAEVERLRAALKRLSDAEYYDVTVTSIARAALEAKL